jgi:hypothetical protein
MTHSEFEALAQLLRLRDGTAKEAIRLHVMDGMTAPNIARALGMKYNLALVATYRIRDSLALLSAAGFTRAD